MGEIADGHGELRRQRPGHDLGERQTQLVLLVVDPAVALDEVALHVADERDGSAEADRAQLEEVGGQLPEGAAVSMRFGVRLGSLVFRSGRVLHRHGLRARRRWKGFAGEIIQEDLHVAPDGAPCGLQILADWRDIVPALEPRRGSRQVVDVASERNDPVGTGHVLLRHQPWSVAGDIDAVRPAASPPRPVRAGRRGRSPPESARNGNPRTAAIRSKSAAARRSWPRCAGTEREWWPTIPCSAPRAIPRVVSRASVARRGPSHGLDHGFAQR